MQRQTIYIYIFVYFYFFILVISNIPTIRDNGTMKRCNSWAIVVVI